MGKGIALVIVVGLASVGLNYSGYFTSRPSEIVQTKNGKVQGVIKVSRDGRDFSAYLG